MTSEEKIILACGCAQAAKIEALRQLGHENEAKDLADVTEYQYMTTKQKLAMQEEVTAMADKKTTGAKTSMPDKIFFKVVKGIL